MLKVNLLRDKSAQKNAKKENAAKSSGTNTNFQDIFGDGLEIKGGADTQGQVIKLFLIIVFVGGLYGFEKYQLDSNSKIISAKNIELEDMRVLLEEKTQSVANLEELKQEQTKQNEYIEDVKSRMVQRMHLLQGLDYIQSAVVKDLWLKSVEYQSGAFTLTGLVLQKSSLDKFYSNLNKIPVFNKSLIIKDSDSTSGVEGAFEFSIMTDLKLKVDKKEGDFGV